MSQSRKPDDHERERTPSILCSIVRALPAIAQDALTAVVIAYAVWFVVLAAPRVAALRADAEASLTQIIANENRAFCEKWGIAVGSRNHALCLADLERIRAVEQARVMQRVAWD